MDICQYYECIGEVLGVSLRSLALWTVIADVVFCTLVVLVVRGRG
jgi:hypothetical protein